MSRKLTELEKRGLDFAVTMGKLPLQERIDIIAQAFGRTTGHLITAPCGGKWRGTSDVFIKFDDGKFDDSEAFFLGNIPTRDVKKKKVINTIVGTNMARYNPITISEIKEKAVAPLLGREAADNAIASEYGLKPYRFLNAEMVKTGSHLGWCYVTLEVDGKIFGFIETGLNRELFTNEFKPNRFNPDKGLHYAGGLKSEDVDFIFNGVGFSSTGYLYQIELSAPALKRAEEALAQRGVLMSGTDKDTLKRGIEGSKDMTENPRFTKDLSDLTPKQVKQISDLFNKLAGDHPSTTSAFDVLFERGGIGLVKDLETDRILLVDDYGRMAGFTKDRYLDAWLAPEDFSWSREQAGVNVAAPSSHAGFAGDFLRLEPLDQSSYVLSDVEYLNSVSVVTDMELLCFKKMGHTDIRDFVENLLSGDVSLTSEEIDIMQEFEEQEQMYSPVFWGALDKIREINQPGLYDTEKQKFKVEGPDAARLIGSVPDKSVSYDEMCDYGYAYPNMLPIASALTAHELFASANVEMCKLYADGTESVCESHEDIEAHIQAVGKGALFGIHKDDWRTAQNRAIAQYQEEGVLLSRGDAGIGVLGVDVSSQGITNEVRFQDAVPDTYNINQMLLLDTNVGFAFAVHEKDNDRTATWRFCVDEDGVPRFYWGKHYTTETEEGITAIQQGEDCFKGKVLDYLGGVPSESLPREVELPAFVRETEKNLSPKPAQNQNTKNHNAKSQTPKKPTEQPSR